MNDAARHEPSAVTDDGPLSGLRVVDLGRFIAGPHCGMLLGDLGADVIKVERVGRGEDSRALMPFMPDGQSAYTMVFNRNKRSLALDFRNELAQDVLRDMLNVADVAIENFRPGTLEKMGCGWETLSVQNPRLILARVSGFGQDGPWATKICTDTIAQALSGLMELTGEPDGQPGLLGTYAVDYATALYTTVGVLAALQRRHITGRGQIVDVTLLDSALSLLVTSLLDYNVNKTIQTRMGNADRYGAPANSFQARDGRWVHVIGSMDAQFLRLMRVVGADDLASDPRMQSVEGRYQHRGLVETAVASWIAARDAREVVATLEAADVQCALIATIPEVAANPQLRHRGSFVDVGNDEIGSAWMQGLTIGFSESPSSMRLRPPKVGEHTDEVLTDWLGYSSERLEELRAASAI